MAQPLSNVRRCLYVFWLMSKASKDVFITVEDVLTNEVEEAGPGIFEARRDLSDPIERFYVDVHKLYDEEDPKERKPQFSLSKVETYLNIARRQVDNFQRILEYALQKQIVRLQKITPEESNELSISPQQEGALMLLKRKQLDLALDTIGAGFDDVSKRIERNHCFAKDVLQLTQSWRIAFAHSSLFIDYCPLSVLFGSQSTCIPLLKDPKSGNAVLDVNGIGISPLTVLKGEIDITKELIEMQRHRMVQVCFTDMSKSAKISKHICQVSRDRIHVESESMISFTICKSDYPNPKLYFKGLSPLVERFAKVFLHEQTIDRFVAIQLEKIERGDLLEDLISRITHLHLRDIAKQSMAGISRNLATKIQIDQRPFFFRAVIEHEDISAVIQLKEESLKVYRTTEPNPLGFLIPIHSKSHLDNVLSQIFQ